MINFHIFRGACFVLFNDFGFIEVIKLREPTPPEPLRDLWQEMCSTNR